MTPELQSKLLRWAAILGGSALVALNKKFGLGMTVEDIAAIAGMIITGVSGSNWKEAQIAGHNAAMKIAGVADAAKFLAAPTTTPVEVPK